MIEKSFLFEYTQCDHCYEAADIVYLNIDCRHVGLCRYCLTAAVCALDDAVAVRDKEIL